MASPEETAAAKSVSFSYKLAIDDVGVWAFETPQLPHIHYLALQYSLLYFFL